MPLTIEQNSGIGESTKLRLITLEEHFTTPGLLRATRPFLPALATGPALEARLLDLDQQRIDAMDEGGIDIQVLSIAASGQESLAPSDATALVREANDAAFAATERHPTRLRMFASLALHQPDEAAKELERGVERLRCVGAFLNGTEGGTFLDDPRYYPIFEAAEALDVPVYIHPTPPSPVVREAYFSNLPEKSAYFLSTAAWGWHAELGMHCLRLILAGTFDRFPRLKVIIGHMGEDLPFSLLRAQDGLPQSVTGLDRTITEYFLNHFYITTSGYFTAAPFRCAMDVIGADRLMYSVDYPYRTNLAGARFLQSLSIPPADLHRIAHGNAERVLKLAF
ncbi:hypothetical protein SAMN05421819_0453 [Bryocella elongata]|uniref:Amidohydrolase-related domain-containing protein n=1 Tax=Bryocella elongata TaxID=863522 RepID=A0A1H5T2P7_9BACT|nr:amidohydrolase family protein [Bryocella elongata]SEF57162.1 hypothetical protein SAMN05421819_0453 [Bryocella elongata]